MKKSKKEFILKELRQAREDSQKRLDKYDALLDELEADGWDDPKGFVLDLEQLVELMKQVRIPLSNEKREEYLGQKFDSTPQRKRIDSIEDKDVAACVFFLGMVADQEKRAHATIEFLKFLGAKPSSEYANKLYIAFETACHFNECSLELAKIDEIKSREFAKMAEELLGFVVGWANSGFNPPAIPEEASVLLEELED
ncbi:MAG: hypothetical protein OEX00_01855 [Gammaproteobacteria bacterium]|nr:hypothetical protein [Gammaproteobacteria bacterium]MDH5692898.1 hypothetical protein [Gammaproteobacteria bacterium]